MTEYEKLFKVYLKKKKKTWTDDLRKSNSKYSKNQIETKSK